MEPFSEEELLEEIKFRAKEAIENNKKGKEGVIPPDTPAYGELWPWIVYKLRSAASERRILFGMKANQLTCWLSDNSSEVRFAHLNFVDYGYPITYEEVDLDMKHPESGISIKDTFKEHPIEEGVKIVNKIVNANKPGLAKLFVQAFHFETFANAPSVDKNEPLADQRIYKPRTYPKEVDESAGILYDLWHTKPHRGFDMYPLPPTMKGFLLMSKSRFQKWLREVTWPVR